MAKNRKAPSPDENGILDTGVYRRNTKPKKLRGAEIADYFRSQARRRRSSILEWLDQHLEFFGSILRPHVKPAEPGESWKLLNIGDGWQGYLVADDIPEIGRDAIEGIDAIRLLRMHLGADGELAPDGGRMDWVIQQVYNLGRIVERIVAVRPFEPLVLVGRTAVIDRPKKMRAAKAARSRQQRADNRQRAKQAIAWARDKYPTAAADDKLSFLKAKAAERLGVTASTLNRWLRTAE